MEHHHISAEHLSLARIREILERHLPLALSDDARTRIVRCREYLDRKMENPERPVYGITTGFGSLCDISVGYDELAQLQKNLVMSHACGTGERVPSEVVKLILLLKIQSLSYGHSGVQLATVERLIDFFNNDLLPVVYQQGSLGASGDLAPLAHMSLPLLGLGEVEYKGAVRPAAGVLSELGWQPIELQSKEGLALLNGTQFMSAYGVWALIQSRRLSEWADRIGALSLDAFDGRIEPFCDEVHLIRAHRGQLATARNIRRLLEGSQLAARPKKHVQDPYSFRCIPQVHGASKDTIDYVESVLTTEINSTTDNPTVFPDEDMVVSAGNFHGQPIALAMDFLAIALAELGNISERRTYKLISGAGNFRSSWSQPGAEQRFHDPAIHRGVDRQPVQRAVHARLGRLDPLVAGAGRPCEHGLQRRHQTLPRGAQHRAGVGHRAVQCRAGARLPPSGAFLRSDRTYGRRVPQAGAVHRQRLGDVPPYRILHPIPPDTMRLLVKNIGTIVGIETAGRLRLCGGEMDRLETFDDAWLLSDDGRIAAFGSMDSLGEMAADEVVDAGGGMLFPSFCDSHTHLVYAGSREQEFLDKINGLTYEQIARRGGGILNSADLLHRTSEEELYRQAMGRIREIAAMGTGAVEIKSGYGLTTADELKMLRVIRRIRETAPLAVRATFLGAHAVPRAYVGRQEEYVDLVCNEMLPAVAAEGLADFVDVFCDEGFFTVEQTARIMKAGRKLGMRAKIHANELAVSGGVQVGVEYDALSVDHLERMGGPEIDALHGTVTSPTMLPGAAFFLGMSYPPAREMINAGLGVALASDYNPGSSPSGNMRMVVSLACIRMRMTPAEAINAATLNGAYAMGLSRDYGSVTVGKVANFFLTVPMPSVAFMPYAYTTPLISRIFLRGEGVVA